MHRFELDGALLLFDRDTGPCALCDGPETAHLRQRAPRFVLQIAGGGPPASLVGPKAAWVTHREECAGVSRSRTALGS